MGQFYTPIILSANGGKTVGSFRTQDYSACIGSKLMEHSYVGDYFVDSVVAKATSAPGAVTIAWLGDYAELNEDVLPLADHRAFAPANNVGNVHRDYVRMFNRLKRVEAGGLYPVSPNDGGVREFLTDSGAVTIYDLVTRQKLSLPAYRKNVLAVRRATGADVDDFIVHPLPILTSIGNGKGGGDYFGTCMEWVGAWAMHQLVFFPLSSGSPIPEGEWEDISEKVYFNVHFEEAR